MIRTQQRLLPVVAGALLLQVTRTQHQAGDTATELELQRKETAKIQQASNDELDKVQLADGATGAIIGGVVRAVGAVSLPV